MAHQADILDAGLRAPAETPKREPRRIRVGLRKPAIVIDSPDEETARAWPITREVAEAHPTTSNGEDPTQPGKSYIERMAEQRRHWKEQDRAKFYNPDRDPDADKTWVVYAWQPNPLGNNTHAWFQVGTRRKKPGRRKPMTINRLFAIIRQQFHLSKDTEVTLISEQDDAARLKRGDALPAPKHHETTRPHAPPARAVAKQPRAKTPRTRIRKDTSPKLVLDKRVDSAGRVSFTFKTKYVAWGRAVSGGSWVYLGPAQEQTKKRALREIGDRFPLYSVVEVRDVKTLSYSLRSRLKSGAVLPGKTKMSLPEA